MIARILATELAQCAKEYPVVTIFGPRQAGKTTLAKMTFPGYACRSLEDPDFRLLAQKDPRGVLDAFPDGVILDEVQRVPELLSYIQGYVDKKPGKKGWFILSGSHQPMLHEAVSQSLAGRTAVLTLFPFSAAELAAYPGSPDTFTRILQGGYPRMHEEKLAAGRYFASYLATHVERDVRQLVNIKNLSLFQNFLKLLAGRVGQLLNLSSLANDAGVTSTTLRAWLDVLKACYLVIELQPWFENVGKRVVKSTKVYFTDTGLLCHLLGITEAGQLARDPLRGSIFENHVILELYKTELNAGRQPDFFFYRDSHGNEVDLVIRTGRRLRPVEIKSAATFVPEFTRGLEKFAALFPKQTVTGKTVYYNGGDAFHFQDVQILPAP